MSNSGETGQPRCVVQLQANESIYVGESIRVLLVRVEPGSARLAVEVNEKKYAAERGRSAEPAMPVRIITDPPLETT